MRITFCLCKSQRMAGASSDTPNAEETAPLCSSSPSQMPASPDLHWRTVLARFFHGLSCASRTAVRHADDIQGALDELLFGDGAIRLMCDSAIETLAVGGDDACPRRPTAPGSFTLQGNFAPEGDACRLAAAASLAGLGTITEIAEWVMGLARWAEALDEGSRANLGEHLASEALPHLAADGPWDLRHATACGAAEWPGVGADALEGCTPLVLRLPFSAKRCSEQFAELWRKVQKLRFRTLVCDAATRAPVGLISIGASEIELRLLVSRGRVVLGAGSVDDEKSCADTMGRAAWAPARDADGAPRVLPWEARAGFGHDFLVCVDIAVGPVLGFMHVRFPLIFMHVAFRLHAAEGRATAAEADDGVARDESGDDLAPTLDGSESAHEASLVQQAARSNKRARADMMSLISQIKPSGGGLDGEIRMRVDKVGRPNGCLDRVIPTAVLQRRLRTLQVCVRLTSGRQLVTSTAALLPRLPRWLVRCLRPLITQSVGEQLALVDSIATPLARDYFDDCPISSSA